MKVVLVIVLVLLAFACADEAKPKVGCHKFCLARALESNFQKEAIKECVKKCLSEFGVDDVVETMEKLKAFRGLMKEDIQAEDAFLSEEFDVESDSFLSNGQQLRATTDLNIRSRPCTDASKLTTVSSGATVVYTGQTSTGCGYTWYSVKGSFGNGWAASNFLTPTGGQGSGCKTRSYPLFKQCDGRWANDHLGSSSTICKVGCLMSSVSMAMNGLGKTINGQSANPQTLNRFLINNGGYYGNLFVWGSVSRFGLSYQGQTSNIQQIKDHICANKIVILNVNRGGHWVLATGVDGNTFYVNDPGYDRSTYSASEVSLAGVFSA